MSGDPREAAERIQRTIAPPRAFAFMSLEEDALMLAKAYLAEHLTDDDEPVTEEFLAMIAEPSNLSAAVYGYKTSVNGVDVCFVPDGARSNRRFLIDLEQGDETITIGLAKTRGQVRLLLRAMQ